MAADGSGHSESHRRHLSHALTEPAPDARAAHRAAFGFDFAFPDLSARRMFPPGQRHGAAPLYAVAGIGALMAPELAIVVAGWAGLIVFAAILLFRAALYRMGPGRLAASPVEGAGNWPTYTLLIALKDEAETAAQLAAAIRALDYPADRLDVKLLIELGDGKPVRRSWRRTGRQERSCSRCRRVCRARSRAR